MHARIVIAAIGLAELVMPKRVARFWVGLFCENPDDVQLRGWVTTGIRVEGLLLLGYVLWKGRDSLPEVGEYPGIPSDFDAQEDIPAVEIESEATEEDEEPVLRQDTTRFTIASALYHADEPLAVSDIVDQAAGTDWEVGRSTASATLYRMYRDELVDRRERDDGRGYVYWLADAGQNALDRAEESIPPNPFQEAE